MSSALTFGIKTTGGATDGAARRARDHRVSLRPGAQVTDHELAPVVAKADRSLKPISIALGVFGAVALLAAVLVATQLIGAPAARTTATT